LRCGGGFIRQPEPQLNNDLKLKLSTKADRNPSAGTAADSSTKADWTSVSRHIANTNVISCFVYTLI
jgi:hypothetical protein